MFYFLTVLIYLLILVGVAFIRGREVHAQDDFMVAGRRLSAPILTGTLLATWIGSGSILGGAGLAYERGLSGLWFNAGGWVAMLCLVFLAPRVRAFAQYTVPDILETRYNAAARVLGTVTTVIAYTGIVSYQFRAGGMVLNLVADIPVEAGMILTALFVIGYTAIAGLISVAYTDVVNGIVMFIGLLIGFPVLWYSAGGMEGLTQALPADHLSVLGVMSPMEVLSYAMPGMLLLLGEGNMYQRFFSARDMQTARRAMIGMVISVVAIDLLIVGLSVLGSARFPGITQESVILHVARHGLPLWIGGLFFAAVVAVIISTADSFLLVPATNLIRDVYQRFMNPSAPQQRILLYSRLCVILLGIVAYLQLRFFASVLDMALYAYTMYGAGVTPAVLAAFLWKRATTAGGISSIAGGMAVTLVWELLDRPGGLDTIFPAVAASLALLIGVSFLTRPPQPKQWEPFYRKK